MYLKFLGRKKKHQTTFNHTDTSRMTGNLMLVLHRIATALTVKSYQVNKLEKI